MFDLLKFFKSPPRLNLIFRFSLAIILILLLIWGIHSCTKTTKSKKELYTIARASTWYPLQLYGRERKLVAFTNDLFASIASENGLRFQWVEASPQSLVEGLESNTYDFIISSIRPNIVNEEHYSFSELLFAFGPVLVVKESSTATSLEQMNQRPTGIISGFSPVFNAIRIAGANTFDPLIITYDNASRAFDALVHGQIDGVIAPVMEAYTIVRGLYSGQLKVITQPLNDEGLRTICLSESELDDVINSINTSINKMKADGTYQQLIHKWDLIDPETDFSKSPSM